MPELPEVETVVRDLNKKIKDYKIVDFWSEWKKALKGVTYAEFKKNIIDKSKYQNHCHSLVSTRLDEGQWKQYWGQSETGIL